MKRAAIVLAAAGVAALAAGIWLVGLALPLPADVRAGGGREVALIVGGGTLAFLGVLLASWGWQRRREP